MVICAVDAPLHQREKSLNCVRCNKPSIFAPGVLFQCVREHLSAVVALMKASKTWKQFMNMLDVSLPRYGDTPYLPFEE